MVPCDHPTGRMRGAPAVPVCRTVPGWPVRRSTGAAVPGRIRPAPGRLRLAACVCPDGRSPRHPAVGQPTPNRRPGATSSSPARRLCSADRRLDPTWSGPCRVDHRRQRRTACCSSTGARRAVMTALRFLCTALGGSPSPVTTEPPPRLALRPMTTITAGGSATPPPPGLRTPQIGAGH